MATLNFPASPSEGDTFDGEDGVTYVYVIDESTNEVWEPQIVSMGLSQDQGDARYIRVSDRPYRAPLLTGGFLLPDLATTGSTIDGDGFAGITLPSDVSGYVEDGRFLSNGTVWFQQGDHWILIPATTDQATFDAALADVNNRVVSFV